MEPWRYANSSGVMELSTTNGRLEVTNVELWPSSELKTINGRISARLQLSEAGDYRVSTVNGSMELDLDGVNSLELKADTVNGNINLSGLSGLVTDEVGRRSFSGHIGEGQARLFLRTVNGSIRMKGSGTSAGRRI